MRQIPFLYILVLFGMNGMFTQDVLGQERLKLESTLAMQDVSWDIWGYYDSIAQKEYAVVGSDGITLVDITDASNPVVVSNVPGVANFDHKVWSHYVYSVTGSGTNGSVGHIIDIKDPLNPVLVDSFPSSHNLFIDEKGYMYASNPGVIIYDLNTDPTKPDSLWKGGNEGHDVTVVGDVLYDFHGRYGTNIYDVTDRKKPVLLSFIDDPLVEYHHQGWISKNGKYLYICDELATNAFGDISVWDISDLENPDRVEGFADNTATIHNIYVVGDWALCSYYSAGVRMFDLLNPAFPVMVDEYDTTPDKDEEGFDGVFGVYPFARNNKLLATDRTKGLYIFTIDTNRTNPDPIEQDFSWEIQPTITNANINLSIAKGTQFLQSEVFYLTMYNAIGQLVMKERIKLNDLFYKSYSLSHLQKGIYHIQVSNGTRDLYQKVMKY